MKSNSDTNPDKYYCTRPFEWFAVLDNGDVSPCCPPWIDGYRIGNLYKQSVDEVWNGEKAQAFRESILDGSFKYCNEMSCPHLQSKSESVFTLYQLEHGDNPKVTKDVKDKKTVLDHGPLIINCEYDRSCNLSCPSCRRDLIIVFGEQRDKILSLQDKLIDGAFSNAQHITITGSGDAFASPVFRNLLQNLKKEQAPELGHILLLTNGLLVNKYWHTLSDYAKENIKTISVSVDAVCPETYAINRRGGDWEQLQDNLAFIQNLKACGQIEHFCISMVVQENNFTQMKDFVLMGESYGACLVQFQIIEPDFIRDLGYGDYLSEWIDKAVHEKTHPRHQEFLDVIQDEFFASYVERYLKASSVRRSERYKYAGTASNMGPLHNLIQGVDISQYETLLKESQEHEKNKDKKDVWFDTTIYYVDWKSIKNINGSDFVRIETGQVLFWNGNEWEICDEDSTDFAEFIKKEEK